MLSAKYEKKRKVDLALHTSFEFWFQRGFSLWEKNEKRKTEHETVYHFNLFMKRKRRWCWIDDIKMTWDKSYFFSLKIILFLRIVNFPFFLLSDVENRHTPSTIITKKNFWSVCSRVESGRDTSIKFYKKKIGNNNNNNKKLSFLFSAVALCVPLALFLSWNSTFHVISKLIFDKGKLFLSI